MNASRVSVSLPPSPSGVGSGFDPQVPLPPPLLGMFQVAHQVWGLRAETRGKEKSHRSKDVLSLGRSFGGYLKRRNRNNFVCKGII